ncbi:hypothetical protein HQ545_03000 [Candidatus Woesearchaeota archaeon]|nr:hypothetical protein [Candidatus Woesearchaeota archaeon]
MRLHTILRDRACINVLKILYDNENLANKYSMLYDNMKSLLAIEEKAYTLLHLEKAGLISSEENGDGGLVLSITSKGKDFIDHFDKLIAVMSGNKTEHKAFHVEYSLTPMEQKVLTICSNIRSESGSEVPLKILTQKVYPRNKVETKTGSVSGYVKKLEKLNLITRKKKHNKVFFDVTDSGYRVVTRQTDENIKHSGHL